MFFVLLTSGDIKRVWGGSDVLYGHSTQNVLINGGQSAKYRYLRNKKSASKCAALGK